MFWSLQGDQLKMWVFFSSGSLVMVQGFCHLGIEILGPGTEHRAGVANLHSWGTEQLL